MAWRGLTTDHKSDLSRLDDATLQLVQFELVLWGTNMPIEYVFSLIMACGVMPKRNSPLKL